MTFSISIIDTLNYEKTIYAIKRTIETLKPILTFDHIYWFSDIPCTENIDYHG